MVRIKFIRRRHVGSSQFEANEIEHHGYPSSPRPPASTQFQDDSPYSQHPVSAQDTMSVDTYQDDQAPGSTERKLLHETPHNGQHHLRADDPSGQLSPQQEIDLHPEISKAKRCKRQTGSMQRTMPAQAGVSVTLNRSSSSAGDTLMRRHKSSRSVISRNGRTRFTAFQAMSLHAHILFHFASCLEIDDLISLYAISKDFHHVTNTALTAVILAQAMHHAPTAATIFPFRCYGKLCIDDPRIEIDRTRGQSRLVPSFRWLRMVCWREQMAQRIHTMLNNEGLYLPQQCETIIKKIWFLMDISDNQCRMATIQNQDLWSISDLFYAVTFFMRIDMRCTNPLAAHSHGNLRRMLMAQPSMSMLCRVLEGTFLTNKDEAIKTYLRWKYIAREDDQDPYFGVPKHELGKMQYEGYGVGDSQVKLQRPDELILKECVRRGLDMKSAFFCILNWTGERPEVEDATEVDESGG